MLTSPLFYAGITVVIAAVWDFKTGKIPNLLTLSSLALALLFLLLFPARTLSSILGMLSLSLLPLLLFLQSKGRGIGGGDIKLLAALGAWLGPELGLAVTITTLTISACVGCVRALVSKLPLKEVNLRLGPFFAIGYFIVLLVGTYQKGLWLEALF